MENIKTQRQIIKYLEEQLEIQKIALSMIMRIEIEEDDELVG